jgi:hypothetical protein
MDEQFKSEIEKRIKFHRDRRDSAIAEANTQNGAMLALEELLKVQPEQPKAAEFEVVK